MQEKNKSEENYGNLHKCPYCACCFCTDADLKCHMERYGTLRNEHATQFQRVHGSLEHGSFNGPE